MQSKGLSRVFSNTMCYREVKTETNSCGNLSPVSIEMPDWNLGDRKHERGGKDVCGRGNSVGKGARNSIYRSSVS